jgi:molybdopterin/thiamine biosynthesis adenylyltransferase
LAVFDFRRNDGPCYRCLFADTLEAEETRCAVMGVFAPLVGVVGTLQACEALKLLADIGTSRVILPAFLFYRDTAAALARYGDEVISRVN